MPLTSCVGAFAFASQSLLLGCDLIQNTCGSGRACAEKSTHRSTSLTSRYNSHAACQTEEPSLKTQGEQVRSHPPGGCLIARVTTHVARAGACCVAHCSSCADDRVTARQTNERRNRGKRTSCERWVEGFDLLPIRQLGCVPAAVLYILGGVLGEGVKTHPDGSVSVGGASRASFESSSWVSVKPRASAAARAPYGTTAGLYLMLGAAMGKRTPRQQR